MKKAFTLAEIMIVLTIIGILTAILMPIALHSAPDEKVMKFKKGNNTLGTVIRELVNSDKYYLNGDLGIKPDGTAVDGTHDGDTTYFCQTFADIVSTKSVNCFDNDSGIGGWVDMAANYENYDKYIYGSNNLDAFCISASIKVGEEIKTTDDIVFYQVNPYYQFGYIWKGARLYGGYLDKNKFSRVYKILCMDIDGLGKNSTNSNCDNECPFGYGLREDGKIIAGARAQEWLQKSIQQGE